MSRLDAALASIGGLDQDAMAAARARQDRLTKPRGALGRLEELSVQLAGITGRVTPSLERKAVVVMAADHGVAQQGISAYPQEVTAQMVANFLGGGAAINVLARQAGARVVVVDAGVAADLPSHPLLVSRKVARGTADFTLGPAMSRQEAHQSIQVGLEVVEDLISQGLDLMATGDMGIGNTTASSALVAAFTGQPPAAVTGRGTGIGQAAWERKVEVVSHGLARHKVDPGDPIDVLARLGGLEIGGLAGVMLGAAAHRVPVVIDGFISGAAALVVVALCPRVKEYLIASHRSAEPGHAAALQGLGLKPLLDLDLRLGEGTGAVLAFPLLEAAVRLLAEMATFADAGVSTALDDALSLSKGEEG
ncbi:MAG: nicotinate-nucleotide--dimethylbenzimidazole phosphoribosyltransferase [Chloroflexi bacterium]|nr:nicotinate-nucleotide--dimethylbenzimidazole phosphoribosyltransferase [Chloroflexota bacterium]